MKRRLYKKITLPPLGHPDEVAGILVEAIKEAKVVHFSTEPFHEKTLQVWLPVIHQIGDPVWLGEDGATGRKNETMWIDVSYHPDRQHTFRHSKTPQPLHTDGAYDAASGRYVLFLGKKRAPSGGETLFVDSEAVTLRARETAPALYQRLVNTPVRFGKFDAPGKQTPIVRLDDDEVWINWNYYRVLADGDEDVERLREDFFAFLHAEFVEKDQCLKIIVEHDEGIFFDDAQVLHGRLAYEAAALNDRCIWKCDIR